jgi:hypothetical protein
MWAALVAVVAVVALAASATVKRTCSTSFATSDSAYAPDSRRADGSSCEWRLSPRW